MLKECLELTKSVIIKKDHANKSMLRIPQIANIIVKKLYNY